MQVTGLSSGEVEKIGADLILSDYLQWCSRRGRFRKRWLHNKTFGVLNTSEVQV